MILHVALQESDLSSSLLLYLGLVNSINLPFIKINLQRSHYILSKLVHVGLTEHHHLSSFIGCKERAFYRHDSLLLRQFEKNGPGCIDFGLVQVESALGEVETRVDLIQDEREYSALHLVLDAAVTESVDLLAVSVQIEYKLEALLSVQVF